MSQPLHKSIQMSDKQFNQLMFGGEPLSELCNVLQKGGTILYPTDTIWGIGCDATNREAIEKINSIKKRDPAKPLSLLASSIDMVKEYVEEMHPRVETLLAHHNRPLTVVYNRAKNLPDNLVPTNGSIAIRIARDEFCKNLINKFGKPIVTTSANINGEPFPAHFGAISSAVISNVDYIAKQGRNNMEPGEPSVIIKVEKNGEIVFLRK
ncbi:MAG: L-threonylcarbamoyladenylate synthase [Saprospiraceae bacterium]